jgi:hypothetical protein
MKQRGVLSLLLIALGIQLYLLSSSVVAPLWRDIRTVVALESGERSARLSFGDQFSDYIQFIVEVVPESGRVVLPPVTVDSTFGNMGIMQFFLFPRSIVNCPSIGVAEECLELYQGDETYFLSVDSFPENSQVGSTRKFLPFGTSLGIFLPYEG